MYGIKKIPWVFLRDVGFSARRLLGTRDKPDNEHLIVDASLDELKDEFRKENFREGWMLSYHYKGEDGNLSRAEFKHGEMNDYQLHMRLYELGHSTVEVHAHIEPCPISNPRKHISGDYLDTPTGVLMVQKLLDDVGIENERKKAGEG